MKKTLFKFLPFTLKQRQLLTWWMKDYSPVAGKDIVIADGAVRSGKTLIMSLSFVTWAMSSFSEKNFGMAGKTIGSFKRNVWITLKLILQLRGYSIHKVPDTDSNNAFRISKNGISNYFYIFGGKDEKSQDLVQGFTAAGFYIDEATLQPQSFVNQAIARCSELGAKIWFNCNPDGPFHWFKLEFIDKLAEKNAFRIHFELDDNPSLSEEVKSRYKRMFSGVFFSRFILGLWVVAQGVIYSMFTAEMVIKKVPAGVTFLKKWIGIDYGQSNATAFILVGLGSDNRLYILDEYYHEGKLEPIQKSPAAYAKDFKKWLLHNGVDDLLLRYDTAFVDPSAKGFMLQLHEEGIRNVRQADNEVLKGIETISSIIQNDLFRILSHCQNTIRELGAYTWDPKAQEKGEDKPIKKYDHALDALRYVVNGTRNIWRRLIVLGPVNPLSK